MSRAQTWWTGSLRVFGFLWRHRTVLVTVALLAGLAGYGVSHLRPARYEATTRLFLTHPQHQWLSWVRQPLVVDVAAHVSQQARFMHSRAVLGEAVTLLNERLTAEELQRRVQVRPEDEDTLVIAVTATAPSAEGAADIADAVARAYQQVLERRAQQTAGAIAAELEPWRAELQRRAAQLQQPATDGPDAVVPQEQVQVVTGQLLDLESRLQDLQVDATLFGSGVELVEEATSPAAPVRPVPVRDAALASVLGLLLAAAYAARAARRHAPVDPHTESAGVLGAPMLGEIPGFTSNEGDSLSGQLALDRGTRAAYRSVLATIEHRLPQLGDASLLITSPMRRNGKTTTALQLAMAACRKGWQVVLVDADLRAQGLTRMLGVQGRTGLSDLALNQLDVDESVHYLPVSDELLLPVVAAGGRVDGPAAFLQGRGFHSALQRIKDEAEMVIVDSSPLSRGMDSLVISGQVGGIVVVVDDRTEPAHLKRMREHLEFVSTPLLGYVYNRSEHPDPVVGGDGSARSVNGTHGRRGPDPEGRAANGRLSTPYVGAPSRGRPEDTAS